MPGLGQGRTGEWLSQGRAGPGGGGCHRIAGLWDGGWLGTELDLGMAAGPGQSRTGWWLRIEQDPGIAQTRTGPGDGSEAEQDPSGGCPGAAGGGTRDPPCPRVNRAPRRAGRARTGIGWRCYGTLYFKEVAVTMAHSNNSAAASPGGRHRMLSRHMISFLLSSALTADISHKCLLYYLPVIVFCAGNGPRNPRPNASRALSCLPVNLSVSGAPGGPASTWASSVTALWDAFVQVPRRAGPAAGTGRGSVPLFAKSVICHFSRGWVFKAVSSG